MVTPGWWPRRRPPVGRRSSAPARALAARSGQFCYSSFARPVVPRSKPARRSAITSARRCQGLVFHDAIPAVGHQSVFFTQQVLMASKVGQWSSGSPAASSCASSAAACFLAWAVPPTMAAQRQARSPGAHRMTWAASCHPIAPKSFAPYATKVNWRQHHGQQSIARF